MFVTTASIVKDLISYHHCPTLKVRVNHGIKNLEFFSDSFDAVRKDSASEANVGVFIAFKCDLLYTEPPELVKVKWM